MNETSPALVAVRHVFERLPHRRGTPRTHHYTVLSYQVAGELDIDHAGKFTLHAGDLHVIPPGHPHAITGATDVEIWSVPFAPDLLDPRRHAELIAPLDRIARGSVPCLTIPEERRPFVMSLFRELSDDAADATARVRNESLTLLLLAELARHSPSVASESRTAPGDLAARAVSFITSRALAPLSLDDVAQALRANRTHVADVVRRATGESVGALITRIRLDEAERRLARTDELVEIISERLGYADPTHFARMFKRRAGCSPSQWRARHRTH